jgi:hypothetical protein
MSILAALMHGLHLFLPAWGMAALLAPALVRWRGVGKRRPRALWASLLLGWCGLSMLGMAVLLLGLWWSGRDGRMLTYTALVLVQGTAVMLWRSR